MSYEEGSAMYALNGRKKKTEELFYGIVKSINTPQLTLMKAALHRNTQDATTQQINTIRDQKTVQ